MITYPTLIFFAGIDDTMDAHPHRSAADVLKNSPPQTAADAVKKPTHNSLFFNPDSRLGTIQQSDGSPKLVLSKDELITLSTPYQHTLVEKFSHGIPPYNTAVAFSKELKLSGEFWVQKLNQKHILIVLSCSEDFSKLWLKREWLIDGLPMRTLKWTPDFDPKCELSVAPVWVRFMDPPIYLFHPGALFSLAATIGKPIKMDVATAQRTRLSYARICVEVDLLAKLPDSVSIEADGTSVKVPIVFENLPKYCSHCRHLGHGVEMCYINGNAPKSTGRRQFPPRDKDGSHCPTSNEQAAAQQDSNGHLPKPSGRVRVPQRDKDASLGACKVDNIIPQPSTLGDGSVLAAVAPIRDKGKAPATSDAGAEVRDSPSRGSFVSHSHLPMVPYHNPSPIDIMFPPNIIDDVDGEALPHCDDNVFDGTPSHGYPSFVQDIGDEHSPREYHFDNHDVFEDAQTSQKIRRSVSLDKLETTSKTAISRKKKSKKAKKAKPNTPYID